METRMHLTLIDPSDDDVYNGDPVDTQIQLDLIDTDFMEDPFVLWII
ncbi:unnamed protein product, partial [marine sediment metagenome]